MGTALAIAFGGAIGSVARYGMTRWIAQTAGSGIWGTFTVNTTGSFILGLIAGFAESRGMNPVLRAGLTVGVLGGYTTFSTLMYESARQVEARDYASMALNLAGSVVVGLAAVALGLALARAWTS
jgi:CrcB protein